MKFKLRQELDKKTKETRPTLYESDYLVSRKKGTACRRIS